jgi:hypothetical protein
MRMLAHFWNSYKGVGLDNVGPGGAGRLQEPVEVLKICFICARMSPLPT